MMIKKIDDWIILGSITLSSLKKIKDKVNKIIKSLKKANLKTLSTRGRSKQYFIDKNIDNGLLKILKKEVLNNYDTLFETDGIKLELVNAWTVLAEKTGWHKLHQHNKDIIIQEDSISIVIYLETPSKISEDYPGNFYYVYKNELDEYIRYKEIQPQEGTIILMPTWLWHGAYPSMGKRQTLNLEFKY